MSARPQKSVSRTVLALACAVTCVAFWGCRSTADRSLPSSWTTCETQHGAITRGPKDQKRIALIFTGHTFADGADTILDELARHGTKASFFLTGAFLANPPFTPVLQRMQAAGHYVGPHSNDHMLYCEWDEKRTTRVTRQEFESDLLANVERLPVHSRNASQEARFFVPPYEHYNEEIAAWSESLGWTLINFTPGTRSNADYTGEADDNFVSSKVIFDSILRREREDPHGLNGFLLLLHLGSGPGREDKFPDRFGELLDELTSLGYQFVRVDALLLPSISTTASGTSGDDSLWEH